MGWASGSSLMCEVIEAAKRELDCGGKSKIAFYRAVIRAFEAEDCDTLDECIGVDRLFDKALEAERREAD
jgi:hypothetical protein